MLTGRVRASPGANLHVSPRGEIIKGLYDGTELVVAGAAGEPDVKTVRGYDWLFVREKAGGRWGYIGAAYVVLEAPQPDVPRPLPEPIRLPPPPRRPFPWLLCLGVLAGLGLFALALWL